MRSPPDLVKEKFTKIGGYDRAATGRAGMTIVDNIYPQPGLDQLLLMKPGSRAPSMVVPPGVCRSRAANRLALWWRFVPQQGRAAGIGRTPGRTVEPETP